MNKKKWTIKDLSLLVCIVLIATVTVGGSLAYLFTNVGPLTNTFTPSKVACEVTEDDFDGKTKSNVKIKNTGNTDAYIRAEVIVTWRDADGNILPQVPEKDIDYEITYVLNNGWSEKDGYYYYNKSIAPGDSTGVLIDNCVQKTDNGHNLCVEIVAEAIQSKGIDSSTNKTPAELAWNVSLGQ